MSYYGIQLPEFWTGETGRAIQQHGGKDATILAAYLTSAPRANMIGLYRLPVADVAAHTPLLETEALVSFLVLAQHDFAYFDPASEIVWVRSMARFRLGLSLDRPALAPGDKKVAAARKLYDGAPANPWLFAFFHNYKSALHLEKRRGHPVKPLTSPLEGALKALGLLGKPDNRSTGTETEDQSGKITAAPRRDFSTTVENHEVPFPHYVRLAHQALNENIHPSDVAEGFKTLCARAHLPYDSEITRKAIEAAEQAREKRAAGAKLAQKVSA